MLCALAYDGSKFRTCALCRPDEQKKVKKPSQDYLRGLQVLYKERGCKPGSKAKLPYLLYDGTKHWTCPRRYEQHEAAEYLSSYGWMANQHVLPTAAGLLSQPAKWVQAMEVIKSTLGTLEENRRARLEQDNASKDVAPNFRMK